MSLWPPDPEYDPLKEDDVSILDEMVEAQGTEGRPSTDGLLLVKVFDQGEPFATIIARNQDEASQMAESLRSCWGADEDSLFEIKVEKPDTLDATMDNMEG